MNPMESESSSAYHACAGHEGTKDEAAVAKNFSGTTGRAADICSAVRSLGPRAAGRVVRDMLFSVNHFYVLARSLNGSLDFPSLRKPDLPLVHLDTEHLVALRKQLDLLDPIDRREVAGRLHFRASGFSNCYVMTDGSDIAYMQWLIFPHENDIIHHRYPTKFYPLSEKQVMVENVFTFPRYRGRGLLPFGTIQLLRLAREKGYSSVICYIRKDNITSLNEFFRMGFKITKLMREYKIMGKVWRTL